MPSLPGGGRNALEMKLKVGITYNLKKDFTRQENQPIDLLEEFDSEETIDAIRKALEGEGHEVIKLGGDPGLIDRLRAGVGRYRFQHRRRSSGTEPRSPHSGSPGISKYPLYRVGPPHPLPYLG